MEDLYSFKNTDVINANERFNVPQKVTEPKIDETISNIVGKKVYTTDPRLLGLIVKWKKGKKQNSMEPDNFFDDTAKINELKLTFEEEL